MKPLHYTLFTIPQTRLILAFLLFSTFMISCKKDKSVIIEDLKFPLEAYYVSEGSEISLHINSGNQKYSLSVSDEELIQTNVNPTDWPVGNIQVRGLKKGSTQLTVKNEVSSQEVVLQIHVVDPYLVMKAFSLIPLIEGADYETDQAIRNKIKNESQNFAEFKEGEVLILQRNEDNQFLVFKNEEDVEKGVIHKSGNYTLSFDFGGPNRLVLDYDDTEDLVEYPIHATNEMIFTKLLDFSRVGQSHTNQAKTNSKISTPSKSDLKAEVRQNTSPVTSYELFLIKDFTSYFKEIHPNIQRVELFQAMSFYSPYNHLNFGEGVLK